MKVAEVIKFRVLERIIQARTSNTHMSETATAPNFTPDWSPIGNVYVQYDESEDQLVDLNTGSLAPVDLQSYDLMTQIIEKMGKI
ncbi:YKL068W-A [Zygosaccharomyces parabailii]|nr:YKL068W-A [Zygosaccharomyces parabailii]SJM88593.1 uncharacterized protein ZBIST_4782 [Zygosaccharomyces bailii]